MATLRDVVASECVGTKGMDEAAASRRFFAIVRAVVTQRASGVAYCGLTDRTVEFDEHGEVVLQLAGAALRGGGTDFLSPEQLRNFTSTAMSDVWALGVLLWHMLDGSLPAIPFGLQRDLEPPFSKNIPHSPSLRRLLRACLMRNWKRRASLKAVAAWEWTIGEKGAAQQRAVQGPIMSPVRSLRSPSSPSGCIGSTPPLSTRGSLPGSSRGSRPPSARGIRPGSARRNPAAGVARTTYPLLHSPHGSAPRGAVQVFPQPPHQSDNSPPVYVVAGREFGYPGERVGGQSAPQAFELEENPHLPLGYHMSASWTAAHGAVQVSAAHQVTGVVLSPTQQRQEHDGQMQRQHFTAYSALHSPLHSPPRERRIGVAPLGPHRRRAFESHVASALHDKWRAQGMLMENMTWAPQLKVVDGVEFDIANLNYSELPERVQESILMSARDACDAVITAATNGRTIDSIFIEEAAEEHHQQWVAEHKTRADPQLLAPYNELDEATKQKDRDVVVEAVRVLKQLVPHLVTVAIPLPDGPTRIIANLRRKRRKSLGGEADSALGSDALRSRRRSADDAAASRHQTDPPQAPPSSRRRSSAWSSAR